MDYMDYSQVALERMVAYMHLDKAMLNHLNRRKTKLSKNFLFISFIPGTVGGAWPPVNGADGCCACGYGGAVLGG